MKKLLQPKVLIPIIFAVAILAALLALSDVKKIVALMLGFQRIYLLWFLVAMIVYEAVRAVQWHFLLKSMEIHVPLRTQIFAFAAGEVTKSMPIGNYFQNYLLQQARGTDFGRSSAATTVIILTEVAVSLVGVVILGLGSWTGWVRPVIIVGVAVFLLIAWAYHRFHHSSRAPRWITEHKLMRKALDELKQFREGAAALFHPRVLAIEGLLGAIYVIVAGVGLYLVTLGLGIGHVSLWQVLAVSFFSLAFALIIPIPVDIGAIEVSAVGAFLAEGVNQSAAVGAVLINRVLSLGASIAIALLVIAFLHGELRAAIQARSSSHTSTPALASEHAADS